MKLTTNKSLIIFYDKLVEEYKFCGVRFFKDNFDYDETVPILYTNSLWIARATKHDLNEGLRA